MHSFLLRERKSHSTVINLESEFNFELGKAIGWIHRRGEKIMRCFLYFCMSIFKVMLRILQLKGKDKQLYWLLAPLVMDPEVIRANNNYAFKTAENFLWYIAIDNNEVVGFIPVEQKKGKKAIINNYYIAAEGEERELILSLLLLDIIAAFGPESWILNSITLIQDKEVFEKHEFIPMDKKWTRYVKMYR